MNETSATLPASLAQRYELRRELGQSQTARVFLCWDTYAEREVALRLGGADVFQGGQDDAAARKAWLSEVRMAVNIRHPYIAEIYDAGFSDGLPFVVGEYFAGGSVSNYCRPLRLLPVTEVLEIIHKCASALEHARQTGMLHRHIRPENIFAIGRGQAKIADFAASHWWAGASLSASLQQLAPELLNGAVPSMQSDIYALGTVLYQLLLGRPPYAAHDPAALREQIQAGHRLALWQLRPELPVSIDEVMGRMLAINPEERYRNWLEVLVALSECSAGLVGVSAVSDRPSDAEIYESLRALPLFSRMNSTEIWELIGISQWRNAPAGTLLLREGDPASSCYMLLRGEGRVTREGRLIAFLDAGTLFGELAFAEDPPEKRVASVVAGTSVTIGKWSYASLLRASAGLQSRMLEVYFRLAAQRLKQSDERYLRLVRQQGGAAGAKA
ncbi:MAG: serine/threonine-protein kinase [Rhodocyclales bacterium]|nr:serine/threonine-protein kinase [Rhodocyclales bacterium]